ncbi:MAG: hypothetical protein ACOX3K_02250 [Bacilli bacterium]|jgi:hypothetical protein
MKVKIKFPFKKSFLHRVYFYVIFAVLVPIFLCAGIELKTTPSKAERFAVFLGADLKPTATISQRIGDYVSEYGNIKNTFSSCAPSNSYFAIRYGAEALLSDLIILPESSFPLVDLSVYSVLSSDNEFFAETNYVFEANKHVGIFFGKGNDCPWSEDVEYQDENYFAFVNRNSVHAEGFEADCKDDQIMAFLRKVFDEKD